MFTGFRPGSLGPEEFPELARSLRTAFAFLRAHGDRRYSPASLMKLLSYADAIDSAALSPTLPQDLPSVVIAELNYTYDEDTEVKSGGVLGVGVLLPDGRLMMAVNNNKRRAFIGTGILQFVRSYFDGGPAVWCHRSNVVGAQFCLSRGLMPWAIREGGAVQYCEEMPTTSDSEAVGYADDNIVESLLRVQRRNNQPRRRPRVTLGDICDEGQEPCPVHYEWASEDDDEMERADR